MPKPQPIVSNATTPQKNTPQLSRPNQPNDPSKGPVKEIAKEVSKEQTPTRSNTPPALPIENGNSAIPLSPQPVDKNKAIQAQLVKTKSGVYQLKVDKRAQRRPATIYISADQESKIWEGSVREGELVKQGKFFFLKKNT